MMGWAGAMVLRAVTSLANGRPLSFYIIVLIATITGFSISLVLSVIYSRLINQKPLVTWGVTAVVLMMAVALSATINGWTVSLYQSGSETSFAQLVLGVFYLDMTLLGAWSALYYAINFFLQVEQQADRLERLEMQATSAQLAMLRYQLNPHFLFNTLNSISTLVLTQQTEPANAMLTRLSGFLRHTLVNEPGGRVTVEEEVETLKLYLAIEQMRFEERLRTRFQIDPAASRAFIPSLLVQPLVENAIKYAVSPQEEGAEITLAARRAGDRLQISVSDTGPGMSKRGESPPRPQPGSPSQTVSTGVGLANIRDRLAQAYGTDHRFAIHSPEEGGFVVRIEIPFEDASEDEPEKPQSLAKPSASPGVEDTSVRSATSKQPDRDGSAQGSFAHMLGQER